MTRFGKQIIKIYKLNVPHSESDSHYRHKQFPSITDKVQHEIPMRIQMHIQSAFSWYYEKLYSELLTSPTSVQTPSMRVLSQKQ